MDNLLTNDKAFRMGELGIFVYAFSSFISKAGINIGIVLMLLASLILLINKRKYSLENEEKYFIFILFLLPVVSFFSPGRFYSFGRVLIKTHRYLGLLLIPIFLKNKEILKKTIFFLSLSLIINFINGIYNYFKIHWDFTYRYMSFTSNTLDNAHMMAMISIFTLVLFIYAKGNRKFEDKIITLSMLIISLTILILSQGRGGWLAFIASSSLILFILIKYEWKFILSILISIILGYILLNNIPEIKNNRYFKRFESIKKIEDPSSQIRILMWKASFDTFKNNLPFGVGRDRFSRYALDYFKKNRTYDEVNYGDKLKNIALSGNQHSMYFKSLSEDGIFSFPFVAMFIYFLYQQLIFLKKVKKETFEYYT